MDTLFNAILIIHIVGGTLGLLSGSINLVMPKGKKLHKRVGNVFLYAMITTGISSLILSVMHPNYFLFMVAIFTLYLVVTGNSYIKLKLKGGNESPLKTDWIITYLMLGAGLLFIIIGAVFIINQKLFGIVFIVFGLISFLFVSTDFKNYNGTSKIKNYWLIAHLQRMTGAYIASVTAFLVVNTQHIPIDLPGAVVWLLPTAVLTPLIIKWSRKYEIRN